MTNCEECEFEIMEIINEGFGNIYDVECSVCGAQAAFPSSVWDFFLERAETRESRKRNKDNMEVQST